MSSSGVENPLQVAWYVRLAGRVDPFTGGLLLKALKRLKVFSINDVLYALIVQQAYIGLVNMDALRRIIAYKIGPYSIRYVPGRDEAKVKNGIVNALPQNYIGLFNQYGIDALHLAVKSVFLKIKEYSYSKPEVKCHLCPEFRPVIQRTYRWRDWEIGVNPFANSFGHFTVINKQHTPQDLTEEDIRDMIDLADQSPGFRVCANDRNFDPQRGGGASIQLHKHLQLMAIPFSIESVDKKIIRQIGEVQESELSWMVKVSLLEGNAGVVLAKQAYEKYAALRVRSPATIFAVKDAKNNGLVKVYIAERNRGRMSRIGDLGAGVPEISGTFVITSKEAFDKVDRKKVPRARIIKILENTLDEIGIKSSSSVILSNDRYTCAQIQEQMHYGKEGYYTSSGEIKFHTNIKEGKICEKIAEKIYVSWQEMGRPLQFKIIEIGGGEGELMLNMMPVFSKRYPDLFDNLAYIIADISMPLLFNIKNKIDPEFKDKIILLKASALGLPFKDGAITGIVICNELVDDLPAHMVIKRNGILKEIYFEKDSSGWFSEKEDAVSHPELIEYFNIAKGAYQLPDNQEFVVNISALKFLEGVFRPLKQGFFVIIDYGELLREDFYARWPSVYCYSLQFYSIRSLLNSGLTINLTSGVDFHTLKDYGAGLGFKVKEAVMLNYWLNIPYITVPSHVLVFSKDIASSAAAPVDERPFAIQQVEIVSPRPGSRYIILPNYKVAVTVDVIVPGYFDPIKDREAVQERVKLILHSNQSGNWQDDENMSFYLMGMKGNRWRFMGTIKGEEIGRFDFTVYALDKKDDKHKKEFADNKAGKTLDNLYGNVIVEVISALSLEEKHKQLERDSIKLELQRQAVDTHLNGKKVIVFIAMEGWSKKGGEGDYVRELSQELARQGHMVIVVNPFFSEPYADISPEPGKLLLDVNIPIGEGGIDLNVFYNLIDNVHYLRFKDVENILYPVVYPETRINEKLYSDTIYGYIEAVALSKAGFHLIRDLYLTPDILHFNDWQAGLGPVYMETLYRHHPEFAASFSDTATVIITHNIAYKGEFDGELYIPENDIFARTLMSRKIIPAQTPVNLEGWLRIPAFNLTNLPWEVFRSEGGVEYWSDRYPGRHSFLKGGLEFANMIAGVSKGNIKEITTEKRGFGLGGVMARKMSQGAVGAVYNGIDTKAYDPTTMKELTEVIDAPRDIRFTQFSPEDTALLSKRTQNKHASQVKINRLIADEAEKPLEQRKIFGRLDEEALGDFMITAVSRLVVQKGFRLLFTELNEDKERGIEKGERLIDLLPRLRGPKQEKVQMVFMASPGDSEGYSLVPLLQQSAQRYAPTGQMVFLNLFNPALAKQIFASGDSFFMPSYYEPGGISNAQAACCGSIPFVTFTGGLNDFVEKSGTLPEFTAFEFEYDDPESMKRSAVSFYDAFRKGFEIFTTDKKRWEDYERGRMRFNNDWKIRVPEYEALYEQAIRRRQQASSGIDMPFNNKLTEIAKREGVGLHKDTRVALFIGGPHIKGGYYYKLFEDVIRQRLGIDLVYLPFVIEEGETAIHQLALVKEQLRNNPRLVGAVITRPWKQSFLDIKASEQTRKIGAVNYIVKKNSELEAFATDGQAWIDGLYRDLGYRYDFKGKKIVILGAGGAARELADVLKGRGIAKITFTDIKQDRLADIREMLESLSVDYAWEYSPSPSQELDVNLQEADIIVNATGIGRGATLNQSPLANYEIFNSKQIVVDLISNEDTLILKEARKRGVRQVFNGYSMFVYGMAGFMKGWLGQLKPEIISVDFDSKLFKEIDDYLKAKNIPSSPIIPYPLLVPYEAQRESEQRYGRDKVLADVAVNGFDLQIPQGLSGDSIELLGQIQKRLNQLSGLSPRAPPEWRLIIPTNLASTQDNVAACDISSKTIFIHPYFFGLSETEQLNIILELLKYVIEQKALSDPISGVWNYISGDIMEKDPHVASKTAPFLSRLYHALERTFSGIRQKEREGCIYPFVGLKALEYSEEQQLFSPQGIDREIRVGFLPIAINPLNWGHILIAFMAINALSLDTVIFRGQGEIRYKDMPESDRVPMRDRHNVLQEVVRRLTPLIRYTDIGTAPNDEKEGFEHMYQFLGLNPEQKIHVFYLLGIENKERVVKYSRQQYELSKKYQLHQNHRVTVGWIQRGAYGASVTMEEMESLYREAQEKAGVSEKFNITLIKDPDIDLNVSSTYYRNSHDAAIIPGIADKHARAHGYYGHPPIDPRTGKPYDISEEEQFKVKLRPIAEGIANQIVRRMERMDHAPVIVVGIDGPSGSGKTTIAKEIVKYTALREYEYCIIGTDIFLKVKEWRGAIEKLVIGEPLTDRDRELLGTLKDSIQQGTFYGEEIFWDNEDIVRVLREVDAFKTSEETSHTVIVKNGYNRDTKIRQDYSFFLKRKMIIIFEGKFTFLDEFTRYFDLTYRVHDNSDRTKAKFEMRTRKLSPNTADRQMKFYEAGMVPSYDKYAEKTQKAVHYLADIATDDWRLVALKEEKNNDETASSAIEYLPVKGQSLVARLKEQNLLPQGYRAQLPELLRVREADAARGFTIIGTFGKDNSGLHLAFDQSYGGLYVVKKLYSKDMEQHSFAISDMIKRLPKGYQGIYQPKLVCAGRNTWTGLRRAYAVIYPFIVGETFEHYFNKYRGRPMFVYARELFDMVIAVAKTAVSLEKYGVFGIWDIAPSNIIITPQKEVILIDYTRKYVCPIRELEYLLYSVVDNVNVKGIKKIFPSLQVVSQKDVNRKIIHRATVLHNRIKQGRVTSIDEFLKELEIIQRIIRQACVSSSVIPGELPTAFIFGGGHGTLFYLEALKGKFKIVRSITSFDGGIFFDSDGKLISRIMDNPSSTGALRAMIEENIPAVGDIANIIVNHSDMQYIRDFLNARFTQWYIQQEEEGIVYVENGKRFTAFEEVIHTLTNRYENAPERKLDNNHPVKDRRYRDFVSQLVEYAGIIDKDAKTKGWAIFDESLGKALGEVKLKVENGDKDISRHFRHSIRNFILYACLLKQRKNNPDSEIHQQWRDALREFTQLTRTGVSVLEQIMLTSCDTAGVEPVAQLANGKYLYGQEEITQHYRCEENSGIEKVFFAAKEDIKAALKERSEVRKALYYPQINPQVVNELRLIDEGNQKKRYALDKSMVIFGPGSQFTSVLLHLMIPGVIKQLAALRHSPRVLMLNSIKDAETEGIKDDDYFEWITGFIECLIKKEIPDGDISSIFDFVVINDVRFNSDEVKDASVKSSSENKPRGKLRQGLINFNIDGIYAFLKKKNNNIALVTGDLMEAIQSEFTYTVTRMNHIFSGMQEFYMQNSGGNLQESPRGIMLVSDTHASIDGALRLMLSFPHDPFAVVGDLSDRGHSLFQLLRLVDNFTSADHELWAISAVLGINRCMSAMYLRMAFAYENDDLLKILGLGEILEMASEKINQMMKQNPAWGKYLKGKSVSQQAGKLFQYLFAKAHYEVYYNEVYGPERDTKAREKLLAELAQVIVYGIHPQQELFALPIHEAVLKIFKDAYGNSKDENSRASLLWALKKKREEINKEKDKSKKALLKNGTIEKLMISGVSVNGRMILSELMKKGIFEEISSEEVRLGANKSPDEADIREIVKDDFEKVWDILQQSQQAIRWIASETEAISEMKKIIGAELIGRNGQLKLMTQDEREFLNTILLVIAHALDDKTATLPALTAHLLKAPLYQVVCPASQIPRTKELEKVRIVDPKNDSPRMLLIHVLPAMNENFEFVDMMGVPLPPRKLKEYYDRLNQEIIRIRLEFIKNKYVDVDGRLFCGFDTQGGEIRIPAGEWFMRLSDSKYGPMFGREHKRIIGEYVEKEAPEPDNIVYDLFYKGKIEGFKILNRKENSKKAYLRDLYGLSDECFISEGDYLKLDKAKINEIQEKVLDYVLNSFNADYIVVGHKKIKDNQINIKVNNKLVVLDPTFAEKGGKVGLLDATPYGAGFWVTRSGYAILKLISMKQVFMEKGEFVESLARDDENFKGLCDTPHFGYEKLEAIQSLLIERMTLRDIYYYEIELPLSRLYSLSGKIYQKDQAGRFNLFGELSRILGKITGKQILSVDDTREALNKLAGSADTGSQIMLNPELIRRLIFILKTMELTGESFANFDDADVILQSALIDKLGIHGQEGKIKEITDIFEKHRVDFPPKELIRRRMDDLFKKLDEVRKDKFEEKSFYLSDILKDKPQRFLLPVILAKTKGIPAIHKLTEFEIRRVDNNGENIVIIDTDETLDRLNVPALSERIADDGLRSANFSLGNISDSLPIPLKASSAVSVFFRQIKAPVDSLWQYSRGKELDSLAQSNNSENGDSTELSDGKDAKKEKKTSSCIFALAGELLSKEKITVLAEDNEGFVFELRHIDRRSNELEIIVSKADKEAGFIDFTIGGMKYAFNKGIPTYPAIESYENGHSGIGRALMSLALALSRIRNEAEFRAYQCCRSEEQFFLDFGFRRVGNSSDFVFDLINTPIPEIMIKGSSPLRRFGALLRMEAKHTFTSRMASPLIMRDETRELSNVNSEQVDAKIKETVSGALKGKMRILTKPDKEAAALWIKYADSRLNAISDEISGRGEEAYVQYKDTYLEWLNNRILLSVVFHEGMLPRDSSKYRRARRILGRIQEINNMPYEYPLIIVNPRVPACEIFAATHNIIFICSRTLDILDDNAMLALGIFHEAAHIEKRHREKITRLEAMHPLDYPYRRSVLDEEALRQEDEADDTAWEWVIKAGYNPNKAIEMFNALLQGYLYDFSPRTLLDIKKRVSRLKSKISISESASPVVKRIILAAVFSAAMLGWGIPRSVGSERTIELPYSNGDLEEEVSLILVLENADEILDVALEQIKCGDLYGTRNSYIQAGKSFHKALMLYKQAIDKLRKQEKTEEEFLQEIVDRIRFIKGKQKELRDKKIIFPDEDSPVFLVFKSSALSNPIFRGGEYPLERGQASKLETNLCGLLSSPVKERENKSGAIQDSRLDPNDGHNDQKSASPLSEDNLGLVLIHSLTEYGAQVSADKSRIEISSDKAIVNAKSVIRVTNGLGVKTTDYLFGLYKTSYISRLVHGLDYGMIYEKNMENHQLNEYIKKMMKAMDIGEEFKVIEAKRIPEEDTKGIPNGKYRIFLTFRNNNGPAISMAIGYPTKKTIYQHEGKAIEHFERFGNHFSTMHTPEGVAVVSPEISEEGIKEVVAESHALGRQALFDFIAWWSPEELTEENDENFVHDGNKYSVEKKCEDILKEKSYAGVVLHLKDGQKVFVECRKDSQDQLVPDLKQRKFWREKYLNDLKYKIDNYRGDGCRVDLPHELHAPDNNLDYTLIYGVFIEAIKYANEKHKKKLYFLLEVYNQDHRDLFRSYNENIGYAAFKNGDTVDYDSLNYPAFKTYFGALREKITEKNLDILIKVIKWLTRKPAASEAEAGYLSNFDEMAAKDALADENYRRNAIALTIFLAKAGFNILLYMRDLLEFSGDFIPVVGGASEQDEGKIYTTHRFLTQEEFEARLKNSLEALITNSFTYKFIETWKNKVITLSENQMEDSKVIFSVKGKGGIECVGSQTEIHFDLRSMTFSEVVSTKIDLSTIGKQVSSSIAEVSLSEYSLPRGRSPPFAQNNKRYASSNILSASSAVTRQSLLSIPEEIIKHHRHILPLTVKTDKKNRMYAEWAMLFGLCEKLLELNDAGKLPITLNENLKLDLTQYFRQEYGLTNVEDNETGIQIKGLFKELEQRKFIKEEHGKYRLLEKEEIIAT
ncbi:MAG TPA: hypothetical protein DCL49_08360, partial [Candidatus Omnitrophica bacterium]|nr:hypothetical protein [Candidatus Omnitrophota bacterium]